jgi:hypothetical protein
MLCRIRAGGRHSRARQRQGTALIWINSGAAMFGDSVE